MRVLWITNVPFDWHKKMLGLDMDSAENSGSWLNAALSAAKKNPSIQLHIVTVGKVRQMVTEEHDGYFFYLLPVGSGIRYDYNSVVNHQYWHKLIDIAKPDVAILWGTELRHSYLAMKYLDGIPKAIFIQGVVTSIYNHYFDGVPSKYQCHTVLDFVNSIVGRSAKAYYGKQSLLEKEMINMADGIIVENEWATNTCKMLNKSVRVFGGKLPIKKCFFEGKWDADSIESYSIFTNAGGYPIKGHHVLFKALAYVKQFYPSFKCYIPGTQLSFYNHYRRKSGYIAFLNRLIKDGKLEDNIIYTGSLSSKEMVKYLERANVFVMPSLVENQSSSLIEAMVVGTPCISSMAGGTQDYIQHNVNGLLYNTLDAVSLASHIVSLFDNKEKAKMMSQNSLSFRKTREDDLGEEMNCIYNQLLQAKELTIEP